MLIIPNIPPQQESVTDPAQCAWPAQLLALTDRKEPGGLSCHTHHLPRACETGQATAVPPGGATHCVGSDGS